MIKLRLNLWKKRSLQTEVNLSGFYKAKSQKGVQQVQNENSKTEWTTLFIPNPATRQEMAKMKNVLISSFMSISMLLSTSITTFLIG